MIRTVIVEDDPMVVSINRDFAKRTPGVEIVAALHSGQEALSFLEESPVDLLLLDVYLPGMSGLELLEVLRQKGSDTEAILVTADSSASHVEKALRLGIVDYLVKPFTYERFQSAMQNLMLRRSLRTKDTCTQADIDMLVNPCRRPVSKPDGGLEKGMQQQTLDLIVESLAPQDESNLGYLTSGQIASRTGLSKVTVRRYMSYLVEQRKVESRINYSTGGRPSMEYAALGSSEMAPSLDMARMSGI